MGKIAFLFTGQGSQYPGMGESVYNASPAAKAVLDMAEKLRPGTLEQCFSPGDCLNYTQNAQPCIFAVSLACAEAVSALGINCQGAAGFSLGELTALAFGGSMTYEEAFLAVCERGRLMQEAAEENPGCMYAVLKLSHEAVSDICSGLRGVYPVNFNCPGQTVVSVLGENADGLLKIVAGAGGKAVRLKVAGAFHSPAMKSACDGFCDQTAKIVFKQPRFPVWSNVNGEPYTGDIGKILPIQIKSPVFWQKTMENMIKCGYTHFIELGPGKTLCGFLERLGGHAAAMGVQDAQSLEEAALALKGDGNGR